MSIFSNIFGNSPAAPAPVTAPQPTSPVAGTDPTGVAQQFPTQEGGPAAFNKSTTQNPLDVYNDLFKPTPVPEGTVTLDDPFITFDKEAVQSLVAKETFTNDPEFAANAQKALAGDVNALMSILDGVARNVFQRNATLTAMVADKAAREGVNRLNSNIPNVIRNTQTNAALTELNPTFSHAGAKPLVDMVSTQFASKNPAATPQQIAEMTVRYLNTLVPSQAAPANTRQAANSLAFDKATDFSNYF